MKRVTFLVMGLLLFGCGGSDDGAAEAPSGSAGSAGYAGSAGADAATLPDGDPEGSVASDAPDAEPEAQPPEDAGEDGGPDAADSSTAALAAPHLDQLSKMAGSLHVYWTNVQPDCDTVRIERRTDTDPWAEQYSVAGTVNNKMDSTANQNVTYTYKLRCEKGGAFSDYSNELSRNPKQ